MVKAAADAQCLDRHYFRCLPCCAVCKSWQVHANLRQQQRIDDMHHRRACGDVRDDDCSFGSRRGHENAWQQQKKGGDTVTPNSFPLFTTGAHAVDLPVLSVLSIRLRQRQARSREACATHVERRRSPLRVWEPISCRLMRPTPSFSCVDDDRKVGRRCPLVMSCTEQDTRLFLACSVADP